MLWLPVSVWDCFDVRTADNGKRVHWEKNSLRPHRRELEPAKRQYCVSVFFSDGRFTS